MTHAEILTHIRKLEAKTQYEMAKKLMISKSLYEKIENGERSVSKKLLLTMKKIYPRLNINIFFDENIHEVCVEGFYTVDELLQKAANG